MELHEVQERLAAAGVLGRDVVLPGAETTVDGAAAPRQGALRVEQVGNGWEVFSSEYGLREVLCRTLTFDEAVQQVLDRVSAPLPQPLPWRPEQLLPARGNMTRAMEQLRELNVRQPGVVVRTTLWDGAVVDRIGPLDGFLLWPEGTPFAHRSQPPDTLDSTVPDLGLTIFGVARDLPVRVKITAPFFGQPGGAPVFKIDAAGVTVRDLLREGALVQLAVADGDGGSAPAQPRRPG